MTNLQNDKFTDFVHRFGAAKSERTYIQRTDAPGGPRPHAGNSHPVGRACSPPTPTNLKHYNGNTENRCKTNHFEWEPYNRIGMQWELEQWHVKLNIKSKPYAKLKA